MQDSLDVQPFARAWSGASPLQRALSAAARREAAEEREALKYFRESTFRVERARSAPHAMSRPECFPVPAVRASQDRQQSLAETGFHKDPEPDSAAAGARS